MIFINKKTFKKHGTKIMKFTVFFIDFLNEIANVS